MAEKAADDPAVWESIFGDPDRPQSLDTTPPTPSSPPSSQDIPQISREASVRGKIELMVQDYANIPFQAKEKVPQYDPIQWWTDLTRTRPLYADIGPLIHPHSPIRHLALALLSCPSSSSSAERMFSTLGLILNTRRNTLSVQGASTECLYQSNFKWLLEMSPKLQPQ